MLDLLELRWNRMPSLTRARFSHACSAVRGGVVVLGGYVNRQDGRGHERTASVEILGREAVGIEEDNASSKVLPPLLCGGVMESAVVAIHEARSEHGQVLLIGGLDGHGPSTAVHKVDLATGVCTPQPPLLAQHGPLEGLAAARLVDGRIVCVGGKYRRDESTEGSALVLEPSSPPPPHGSPRSEATTSWRWRYLPDLSVCRPYDGSACVLSDGLVCNLRRLRQAFGSHDIVRGADAGWRYRAVAPITADARGTEWLCMRGSWRVHHCRRR